MPQMNDLVILISGDSKAGKSTSLQFMEHQERAILCNCEAGKKLPFPDHFRKMTITDPYTVQSIFADAELPENKDKIDTIVIDGLNYLMDMFESVHVLPAADTQKAWSMYSQFFKTLMQQSVARSTKNVIFLAHALPVYNDSEKIIEKKVPIKGASKGTVESYFTIVISAKKVSLVTLENFQNEYLHISEDEQELGFKHVFQTRLTKDTINERISAPMGMWSKQETYIDNNIQFVIDRLRQYYKP